MSYELISSQGPSHGTRPTRPLIYSHITGIIRRQKHGTMTCEFATLNINTPCNHRLPYMRESIHEIFETEDMLNELEHLYP